MKMILYCLYSLMLLCSMVLCPCRANAQEHFPDYFELESEIILPESSYTAQSGKLIGCLDGDALYLCNAEVVGKRKNGREVVVECWDLAAMTNTTHKLILPCRKGAPQWQNRYWLYSITVCGQRLLLTTSGHIYEYELSHSGTARLLHDYELSNADFSYYDSQGMKAVTQVNDVGFKLLQVRDRSLVPVTDLPLPAPFLLQFRPNRLLQPGEDHLFLIPTPLPALKILDLQGQVLAESPLPISNWTDMPESYINKIESIPYSGDRAMHIFHSSTPYSFPLELFVLDDSTFLISYHQYDSTTATLTTPFLLLQTNSQGQVKQSAILRPGYEKGHLYLGDEYPFYYAHRALSLMLTGNRRIVQVVKTSDETYVRRTPDDYEEAQQRFFADHPPIMKIRVLRLKRELPQVSCKELPLVNGKGEPFSWDSLPNRRTVVVVNESPQCHACEEGILTCLNDLTVPEGSLYIVERKCTDQLCRRERLQKIQQQLTIPFIPLYVLPKDEERFSQNMELRHYPLVLLVDKETGNAAILSDSQLFPDNPSQTDIRPEARLEIIRHLR